MDSIVRLSEISLLDGADEWDAIHSALSAPFPEEAIEWRIGRAGKNSSSGVWATCLAYLTNRAIQDRLDAVVGAGYWHNEFIAGPQGGILCGLTVCGVTKWDGAENTEIESVKGGISDAMKRAAVQWGIGRYLYGLPEGFAETSFTKKPGWKYGRLPKKDGGDVIYWNPPRIPQEFLPAGAPAPEKKATNKPSEKDKVLDLVKTVGDVDALNMLYKKHLEASKSGKWYDDLFSACQKRKAELNG